MKKNNRPFRILLAAIAAFCFATVSHAADDYYTGEQVFELRPKFDAPKELGHIGPIGILARVEKGVKVTIQGTREGSPAADKFNAGEVILAVNGKSLKGLNPYIVLGSAITAAEASDGKMVFDLESKEGRQRSVAIEIPILGAYGPNWPADCQKSKKIIEAAAAFYHKSVSESNDLGVGGALSCLFLLSTGDDAHLPVVKKHYQKFIDNPEGIGDHTWNNGYNGIACAEYYLRTGDRDMLPVLQAFCDDAKERQNFNSAWKHWGATINPAYVGGGLMNPASAQVLTTLLLCKEAGVDVDEKTLLNALRYFWRFVGHGSVPYGDHRAEGGVGSNGKDAMIAIAMQVAAGTSGDASIYASARDSLSMATVNSCPGMVMGHADNGRGDGIWRGIASSYLMKKDPKRYRKVMNSITWWYDLSRFDDGAIGLAACPGHNNAGSGAGAALTYTAPLKTLRITGAPRSKYGKEFKLPARLWGNETDLAFHNIKPAAGYENYGKPMPIHRIIPLIGSAYGKSTIETDPDSLSVEQLNQFVRHNSYMIRAQAAKALRIKGELKILEELLRDPDPRLRRTALDGIIDWRYFFAVGKEPLDAERFTPGMIASITVMLTDPSESAYVMEGALFAVGFMPVDVIQKNLKAVLPWLKSDEWWLRHASFMAIQGLESDPALYVKVLPTLIEMMVAENHTMPRQGMNNALARTLKAQGPSSDIGRLLVKGFNKGVSETQVLDGPRGREGKFNIKSTINSMTRIAPETAPQLAALLVERGLCTLDNDELLDLVSGGRVFKGFLSLLPKLKGLERKNLEDVLYESYRPEVSKRLEAGGGKDMVAIDALLGIIQLRDKDAGWQSIGSPNFEERIWRYISFEPTAKEDILPKHEGRRYREVELPSEFKDWFKPEFDASKWQSGKALIGKGEHARGPRNPVYQSAWGEGEILLARTTFELDEIDCDQYRLRTRINNGFIVYLNGKRIRNYSWWSDPPAYSKWPMGAKEAGLLKKGTNTIAVYAIAVYPSSIKAHWKPKVFGEMDSYIEGLRKEDLYIDTTSTKNEGEGPAPK